MSKLKAVVFDWDGVLVPIRVDLRTVFEYIINKFAEHGISFEIKGDTFSTIEALIKAAKKDFKEKSIPDSFFNKLQEEVLVLINEIFTKDAFTNSLDKEISQTLKQIRELGLKMGIFTINRFHVVDKILTNSNATHLFDAIVTQDDFHLDFEELDKKEHLNACLEQLQVSGCECIVVGDRPVDIFPAYEVNAITVGIINSENRNRMKKIEDKIDYMIDSLTDLYQIITDITIDCGDELP
jgi:phosphoglycolate phosphatase-like HAD superfamily hydrolase